MKTLELTTGEPFEIVVAGIVVGHLVHTRLTKRRRPLVQLDLPPDIDIRPVPKTENPPVGEWDFP